MDVRRFPSEILERIFIHLDTQALAACALADSHLATIVYSPHFLDEYLRAFLGCTWVTVTDVFDGSLSVPYEFWFWVHTAIEAEQSGCGGVHLHNKQLTKIGTLRHMYLMWLTCGLRPSLLYSYSLLHEFYVLPESVDRLFASIGEDPGARVKDQLAKIFLGLPEIMELTCGHTEHFRMQCGGTTSLSMDMVCNEGVKPKLPLNFVPLFSVELILSALFGKSPSLLILIGEGLWVLWLGYLSISLESNQTSILESVFCKHFQRESVSDIRYHAHNALLDLNNYANGTRSGSVCPVITGPQSDMAMVSIELAQDHHRGLQQRFDLLLQRGTHSMVSRVLALSRKSGVKDEIIVEFLRHRVCSVFDEEDDLFVDFQNLNLVQVNVNMSNQINSLVYKCILERVGCLYRNEIQFYMENRFCHSFLCRCVNFPVESKERNITQSNAEQKIEKCVSERVKDGLNSLRFWPPHVLSAGCQAIPLLLEVLESDMVFVTMRSSKNTIPPGAQALANERLQDVGMCLNNRPPNKPRCPPLLTQIRLWTLDGFA